MVPVENCTGCAACCICCPQEAIDMKEDSEGFLYPRIDQKKCNSCNLCIDGCPVQSAPTNKSIGVPTLYAGWTNDLELLRQSTSGGVFSEIARVVIEEGGVVFGAAYDKTMTVRHVAVDTWDNLQALRGSKYVQSDVGDTYRQAERHLRSERRVLFSGTPCQIAGLHAALKKNYDNLLTCDLICKGVPSPKVFRMAIAAIEKRYRSRVAEYFFREKSFGWLHPTVLIAFANGLLHAEISTDNHFNLGFQKNIYLRPACHQCPIKLGGPVSDITLGDFWQLLTYKPALVHRGGTSAVVVNTERGRQSIHACSARLALTECSFEIIENESSLRKSHKPSPERAAFFANIDRLSFEELTRKYIKPRGAVLRRLARIRRVCRRWIEARK